MTVLSGSNPIARVLAQWEKEGGSPQTQSSDFDQTAILQHLGTAVMMRWGHLPREVQRELFNAAVELDEPVVDAQAVRQNVAVFLHQHRNDERIVDRGGEA